MTISKMVGRWETLLLLLKTKELENTITNIMTFRLKNCSVRLSDVHENFSSDLLLFYI